MKRNAVVFVDLLFLLIIVLLVTTMVKTPVRKAAIQNTAEYMAILTWDDLSASDVDLHMLSPDGYKVDFRQKTKSVYSLERDDLGKRNDSVIRGEKRVFTLKNEEILTLRGWVEGRYVFGVMLWSQKEDAVIGRVIVYRLNPRISVIMETPFILTAKGQEKTVARITLDINGDVRDRDAVFQSIAIKRGNE